MRSDREERTTHCLKTFPVALFREDPGRSWLNPTLHVVFSGVHSTNSIGGMIGRATRANREIQVTVLVWNIASFFFF